MQHENEKNEIFSRSSAPTFPPQIAKLQKLNFVVMMIGERELENRIAISWVKVILFPSGCLTTTSKLYKEA